MMTGLTIFRDLGDHWGVAEQLDGLSAVSAAAGNWQRAARLAGAAEATWERIGAMAHPADRASADRWLHPVLQGIEGREWRTPFGQGRAMLLEDVLRYALGQ